MGFNIIKFYISSGGAKNHGFFNLNKVANKPDISSIMINLILY